MIEVDRDVGPLGVAKDALELLVGGALFYAALVWSVGNQAAGFHELTRFIDGWQALLGCEIHYSVPVLEREGVHECQQRIDAAVERYLATGPRAPETMFDHLYAELPKVYASQREELEHKRHGTTDG